MYPPHRDGPWHAPHVCVPSKTTGAVEVHRLHSVPRDRVLDVLLYSELQCTTVVR